MGQGEGEGASATFLQQKTAQDKEGKGLHESTLKKPKPEFLYDKTSPKKGGKGADVQGY